jgi:hypothetical protein
LNCAVLFGAPQRGRSKTSEDGMSIVRVAAAAVIGALSVADAAAKSATVTAEVNLRKGPGTDTEVLTLIPKGSTVEVDKCEKGWCQVKFNDLDGYSIAQNLGLGGPRPVRRPVGPPGYGPPGYGPEGYGPQPGYGPQVVYGPGPAYVVGPPPPAYYYYGPGPYWGPYWRWRRW